MRYDGVMDERDFFTERPQQMPAQYTCPRCKRRNEYQVRWMRRTKKDRLPPGADARDRALYAKLKRLSYSHGRRRGLQDLPEALRDSVASVDGVRGFIGQGAGAAP